MIYFNDPTVYQTAAILIRHRWTPDSGVPIVGSLEIIARDPDGNELLVAVLHAHNNGQRDAIKVELSDELLIQPSVVTVGCSRTIQH